MKNQYADVIVDLSVKNVDRAFQYRIPEALFDRVTLGAQVSVPFGKGDGFRKGIVVGLSAVPSFDPGKLKEIAGILPGAVSMDSQMLALAYWMKERYGSTFNQALKTVLPVKAKVVPNRDRIISACVEKEELLPLLWEAEKKNYRARVRFLTALIENKELPYRLTMQKLGLTAAVLKPFLEKKIISLRTVDSNPVFGNRKDGRSGEGKTENGKTEGERPLRLTEEQRQAVSTFLSDYEAGKQETYLLYGITGSGKTEVYMEAIGRVLEDGKQAIVLIPEISLTYQTVMRFYRRFGGRVGILNSRMSAGERYEQSMLAAEGKIDIMIGPRSALFTPFPKLGLIIIDEEHEGAYQSETAPRYDARETAAVRARMNGASLILGSATPSVESYYRAEQGEYRLLRLTKRAKEHSRLAGVHVADLREELSEGNRSVFSRQLTALIKDRLQKKEQIMLFMNRRGYANFVSCRSCGKSVKCPHCDVSLTYHRDGRLRCHYCGFERPMPDRCPNCGSPFIAPFGAGTQKLEEMTAKLFPEARILRMDADTTAKKGAHEAILQAFFEGEADILIGTQMIVKGHDFPRVTLVGIMAADLSLYAPDYKSAERTFQLLTQASGRAGRDEAPGDVVIQTYTPDHFAVAAAASQDYLQFYRQELLYRQIMKYPPAVGLLTLQLTSKNEGRLSRMTDALFKELERQFCFQGFIFIGPVNGTPYKVNDIYRKILYIKHENYDILIQARKSALAFAEGTGKDPAVELSFCETR